MVTINIGGIDKAIKNIEKYCESIPKRTQQLCNELAYAAADIAEGIFKETSDGDDIEVYVVLEDGGSSVVASGQQVCFIEFGAGVYAQDSPMNPGIKIYPGSWSETHKGTYQRWEKSGMPMEAYPYNLIPANAMLQAYNAIIDNFDTYAERIFR